MQRKKLHRVVQLLSMRGEVPAPADSIVAGAEPAAPSDPSQGLLARLRDALRRYLREERAFWTANQDIELSQLLERLRKVVDDDRSLRKAASPLMFLVASDLRESQRDDSPGPSAIHARPMRAWQQRYNGLGRFLAA